MTLTLWLIILVLLLTFVLAVSFRYFYSSYKLRRYGTRTKGIVLEEKIIRSNKFLLVEFSDENGRKHQVENIYEVSIFKKINILDRILEVDVSYDPENPKRAVFGENLAPSKASLIGLIILAALFLLTIPVLFLLAL